MLRKQRKLGKGARSLHLQNSLYMYIFFFDLHPCSRCKFYREACSRSW